MISGSGEASRTNRRTVLYAIGSIGAPWTIDQSRTIQPSSIVGSARQNTAVTDDVQIAYDPYDGVAWDSASTHKCEFHNHVRGPISQPAEIVDLYHDLGYTIFAVADHGDDPMKWPWTDFAAIDSGYENRDPASLGVVSFPACEFIATEHVSALFTTLTHATADIGAIDDRLDQSRQIVDRTDHYVPADRGGMAVIAHPFLYYGNPESSWERYRPDFETLSREQGMLGLEVFNRASIFGHDVVLWDRLLTAFAPERMIWGFGVDDPTEYIVGTDVDVKWTSIVLDDQAFDPSDQDGTRQAAATAMVTGQTMLHRRDQWDATEETAPPVPQVHSITADSDAGTIQIDASEYDLLAWVSNGAVVSRDETVELAPEHVPYIRAHLQNDGGGETSTQPFGLTST